MTYIGTKEYLLEVGRGNVAGASLVNKFGRNLDIDNAPGTFESLANQGGLYTGHNATGAETISIASTSASDTGDLQVYGLDGSGVAQNETVTLTGVTPALTSGTYLRCFRAINRSGTAHVGTVTGNQSATTANVFFVIPIGYEQTQLACYTIPAGKVGWIYTTWASVSKPPAAHYNDVRLVARPSGEVFAVKEEWTLSDGAQFIERTFTIPEGPFSALTDIELRADSDTNNVAMKGGFDLVLVDA